MIIASTTLVSSSNSAAVNTSNIDAQLALGHTIDFSSHGTGGAINTITMDHPDCAITGNGTHNCSIVGINFYNGVRISYISTGIIRFYPYTNATNLVISHVEANVFSNALANTRGLIIEYITMTRLYTTVIGGAFNGTTIRNCHVIGPILAAIGGSDNLVYDNYCDAQYRSINCFKFFPSSGAGSCRNNKIYGNTFLGSAEENLSYDGWQSGSCKYDGYVGSTTGSTIRVHTLRENPNGCLVYQWSSTDLLICEGEHRTRHFPLVTIRKNGVDASAYDSLGNIGDYLTGVGDPEVYYEIDVDGDLPELVPGTFIQVVTMFIGNELYNNILGDTYVPVSEIPMDSDGYPLRNFCIPQTRILRGGTDYYGGAPLSFSFGCLDNHIHHNTLVSRQPYASASTPSALCGVQFAAIATGNSPHEQHAMNLCHGNIIEYNDITARFPFSIDYLVGVRNPYHIEGFAAYYWYFEPDDPFFETWVTGAGEWNIPTLVPFMPIENGFGNAWNMNHPIAETLDHPIVGPPGPPGPHRPSIRSTLKALPQEGNVFRYNIIRDTVQLYPDAEPVFIYDRFPDHSIYVSDGNTAIYGNSTNIPITNYNVRSSFISPKVYGRNCFHDMSKIASTQPTRTGLRAISASRFDSVVLTNDSGGDIRYTVGVNPDEPTVESTLYTVPINLSPGRTIIKAATFINGVQTEIITESYALPQYRIRTSLTTQGTEIVANPLLALASGPWDHVWTKYATVTLFNPGSPCWAVLSVRKWIGWERVIKIPHGEFQVDLCNIPNEYTSGAWWEPIPNALVQDIWFFGVMIPSPVHSYNTKVYRTNYPNTIPLQLSSNIISFITPDYVLPRNPDGSFPFDHLTYNFVENP